MGTNDDPCSIAFTDERVQMNSKQREDVISFFILMVLAAGIYLFLKYCI